MILLLPLFLPVFIAIAVLLFKNGKQATTVAVSAGFLEVALLIRLMFHIYRYNAVTVGRYLRADGLTLLFLAGLAFVLLVTLLYSVNYLRHVPIGRFSSPRWFYCLTFLFVFAMLASYLAQHLDLLWISMEATPPSSASLGGVHDTGGA